MTLTVCQPPACSKDIDQSLAVIVIISSLLLLHLFIIEHRSCDAAYQINMQPGSGRASHPPGVSHPQPVHQAQAGLINHHQLHFGGRSADMEVKGNQSAVQPLPVLCQA